MSAVLQVALFLIISGPWDVNGCRWDMTTLILTPRIFLFCRNTLLSKCWCIAHWDSFTKKCATYGGQKITTDINFAVTTGRKLSIKNYRIFNECNFKPPYFKMRRSWTVQTRQDAICITLTVLKANFCERYLHYIVTVNHLFRSQAH